MADLVFPGRVLCAFLHVLISLTGAVKPSCFNAAVLFVLQRAGDTDMACESQMGLNKGCS